MKKRIITRTVWLLSVVSLLTDISSEMLYPVMPVYLKSIGFSFFLIGLLEGIAEAIAGLSKGYFGSLSDALGRRMPFVQAGYALSAVAKGLLALFTGVAPVFMARLADRMGKGVRTAARDALLSDESAQTTRARVFGLHRAMDTLGAAIGPLLALAWLYCYPAQYVQVFAIAFLPGLLSVAFTFTIREKKRQAQAITAPRPGWFSYFRYWKKARPGYRAAAGGLAVFALVNSSDMFLLLAVKAGGFSDTQMIGAYVFYNLVFALLAYPAGRLADRLGTMRVVTLGLLIFALVYFAIGFASSLPVFLVLFCAYALYAACYDSTAKAMISNLCRKEESGTALGLYSSLTSLGAVVAGAWTGLVWMTLGAFTAFMISASVALLVVLFFLMLARDGNKAHTNHVGSV